MIWFSAYFAFSAIIQGSVMIIVMDQLRAFFFYGFIVTLPWQTIYFLREVFVGGEKWQYGTIGIYASDLFLVGFVLSVLIYSWRTIPWREVFSSRLTSAFLSFVGFIFLSTLWSSDPALTALYGVRIFLAGLFVFSLQHFPCSFRRACVVLCVGMLGHAVLSLWQFFSQSSFSSTLLGISQYEAYMGGVSVVESFGGDSDGRWLRAYGGFTHPNILGAMMGLMSIFSLGAFLCFGRDKVFRWFFLVASVLFFASLLVSFSRSGMIGFLFGVSLLGIFAWHSDRFRIYRNKLFLGVIFGYMLTFGVFFLAFGDLYETRVQGSARLEQISLDERTSQVGEAFDVISQSSVLGVGAGTYTKYLYDADEEQRPIWQYQPVHNVDLLILAEIGFLGSGLLLFLLWQLFVQLRRKYDGGLFVTKVIVATLVGFLVCAIFDHWQWDSHFGVLVFGVLIGFMLSSEIENIYE